MGLTGLHSGLAGGGPLRSLWGVCPLRSLWGGLSPPASQFPEATCFPGLRPRVCPRAATSGPPRPSRAALSPAPPSGSLCRVLRSHWTREDDPGRASFFKVNSLAACIPLTVYLTFSPVSGTGV